MHSLNYDEIRERDKREKHGDIGRQRWREREGERRRKIEKERHTERESLIFCKSQI